MFRMSLKDRQVTIDTTRRAVHCTEREAVQRVESGTGDERWGQHRCRIQLSHTHQEHASNPSALRMERSASSLGSLWWRPEWRWPFQLSRKL